MKKRALKLAKTACKIIISIAALWLVFREIDLNEILGYYKNSSLILLIAAFLIYFFSQIISSFRLNFALREKHIYLSNVNNFRLYLVGMFYNLFLPGGLGGDGYKMYVF